MTVISSLKQIANDGDVCFIMYEDAVVPNTSISQVECSGANTSSPKSIMIFSRWIIDDVLSLNNPKCNEYIEIKDNTGAPKWPNYLDHHLEFDEGKHFTRLYDKHDDFDFPIVHVPYLSSNIPESPAYEYFLFRGSSLVSKHGYSSRKQTTLCWRVCSPNVTYDGCPVIDVNRDGCQMWGRKCSLFPEHLTSLPLGSSWFTHSLYMHYIIVILRNMFLDWWLSIDCFVVDVFSWTYCIITIKDNNFLLTSRHLTDSASTQTLHP